MYSKKKLLFIINPIAGTRSKSDLPSLIENAFGPHLTYKILYWKYPQQNLKDLIFKEISEHKFNIVVAVGGDGTVNKIAGIINNTDISLAIIPLGSGNGLARHLKIPIDIKKSLNIIKTGINTKIDSGKINEHTFFCTAGFGFDAHIGHVFSETKKRGLFSYIKIILTEFFAYKMKDYSIKIDETIVTRKSLLVTFANANQWGNNAKISPNADIKDGILNVIFLQKANLLKSLFFGLRLFFGSANKSSLTKNYQGKTIIFEQNSKIPIHYDGEPAIANNTIKIKINTLSLNVIVNRNPI